MEMLTVLKWVFFAGNEIAAWVTTVLALNALIRKKNIKQFKKYGIIAAITGIVPHVCLALYDYLKYGRLSAFSITVIVVLAFGILFGGLIKKKIEKYMRTKYEPTKA